MSRIVLVVLLMVAGLRTSAQDSLTHRSVVVYKFKGFNIILVAQPIIDSLLDFPSINTASSARQRNITMYGLLLRVFLTTNKKPFHQPVREVLFDNAPHEQETISPQDLEVRLAYPDKSQYGTWKDLNSYPLLHKDSSITLFPLTPGSLPVMKGNYYTILDRAVATYAVLEISIRNKITQEEIINFHFWSIDDPVSPFLIQETQDESNKKLIDSFIKVRENLMEKPDINGIYGFVEEKGRDKSPEMSRILRNEPLYKTSELVLYFRMQHHSYPDSSMEYRLLSESDNDTTWRKTGHRMVIPQLVAGNHYKLQIRYEMHPAYIQEHTFYVAPKWYRTTQAIVLYICVLVLAGLLGWLLIYRRKLSSSRRRREQLSLEIRAIRSQLNPHFIFNALSSIQGLINKNEIPAANRYLTEFSSLLRDTLHNSEKEMVALVSEVHLLETYLKLEQLRFNFSHQINIDPAIDKNGTELPNLLLQPLVENAVKHGVATLGESGFIKIHFVKKDQDLLVSIIDNGNKFSESQAANGFGLKLTRNRIALLGQTLKEQPIYLTIERSPERETIVHLVFKNWL